METRTDFTSVQWCAGFFEGDGAVSSGAVAGLTASQNYPDPLMTLRYNFGGKVYYRNDRNMFSWHVGTQDEFVHAVAMMSPYWFKKYDDLLAKDIFVSPLAIDHSIEWVAGFFEADGSCFVNKQAKLKRTKEGRVRTGEFHMYPQASFAQSHDSRSLEKVQEFFGDGTIYSKGDQFSLVFRNGAAIDIMDKMLPFLSKRRLTQYNKVLKSCDMEVKL